MKRLNKLNVGDLVKFFYIYNECALNNALAIYLGEDIIERDDGHKIINHRVQLVGDLHHTTIDKGLIPFLQVVNATR
jgi:hypothetical protein